MPVVGIAVAQSDLASTALETAPRQKLCEARRVGDEAHLLVAFRTARWRVIVFVKHASLPSFLGLGVPIHVEQQFCINDNGNNDGD
jgi:hypothetical protein